LSRLLRDIEPGEIGAIKELVFPHSAYYESKTLSFLNVLELLTWWIFNDCILPDRLQNEFGIYQIADADKIKENYRDSVKNQIVAQYILGNYPIITKNDLYQHPWMGVHGTGQKSNDSERKTIQNQVGYLFERKRGQVCCITPI